jgi:hypothetical protein
MLFFESNKVFHNNNNSLESLEEYKSMEDYKSPETTRVWKTIRSIKLQNHEESGKLQSQEVCKNKKRLPGLKKPVPRESGRPQESRSR